MDDFARQPEKVAVITRPGDHINEVAIRRGTRVLSAHILSWSQSKLKLTDNWPVGKILCPLSNISQA